MYSAVSYSISSIGRIIAPLPSATPTDPIVCFESLVCVAHLDSWRESDVENVATSFTVAPYVIPPYVILGSEQFSTVSIGKSATLERRSVGRSP